MTDRTQRGSTADYDALCEAWDKWLAANGLTDQTIALDDKAEDAFNRMFKLAVAIDPTCLREGSVVAWIERRVASYRKACGEGFNV